MLVALKVSQTAPAAVLVNIGYPPFNSGMQSATPSTPASLVQLFMDWDQSVVFTHS